MLICLIIKKKVSNTKGLTLRVKKIWKLILEAISLYKTLLNKCITGSYQ